MAVCVWLLVQQSREEYKNEGYAESEVPFGFSRTQSQTTVLSHDRSGMGAQPAARYPYPGSYEYGGRDYAKDYANRTYGGGGSIEYGGPAYGGGGSYSEKPSYPGDYSFVDTSYENRSYGDRSYGSKPYGQQYKQKLYRDDDRRDHEYDQDVSYSGSSYHSRGHYNQSEV